MPADDSATAAAGNPRKPVRPGWWAEIRRLAAVLGGGRAARSDLPRLPIADRVVARYGLALAFVAAATAATFLIEGLTGRLSTFPFYAAVVASAWFGIGPGIVSLVLTAVAAADFWTPAPFSLNIEAVELPSFGAFIICTLMSLAWSSQRRRAQHALEATVQQRTADLVHANAALQAEMAEREAVEEHRKRTERALRDAEAELARTLRLATVAELAAAIAHEINQPLAAITANGSACLRSLTRQPPLLDNAREAAACIVADGHRAGDVIARIRALFNKEQPNQQRLNVNDTIRHVLALSRGATERQRVVVRTDLAAAEPWVMADPVQLQQVMVNLVTNALEAMSGAADRSRLLTVRSEARTEENHGAVVAVTVEDSGSGLDPEHISNIFDSFYTTKPGGIGLGLAISRSIIEAHGGSMWAAPGTRDGAKFGFSLPAGRDGGAADIR